VLEFPSRLSLASTPTYIYTVVVVLLFIHRPELDYGLVQAADATKRMLETGGVQLLNNTYMHSIFVYMQHWGCACAGQVLARSGRLASLAENMDAAYL